MPSSLCLARTVNAWPAFEPQGPLCAIRLGKPVETAGIVALATHTVPLVLSAGTMRRLLISSCHVRHWLAELLPRDIADGFRLP